MNFSGFTFVNQQFQAIFEIQIQIEEAQRATLPNELVREVL